MRPLCKRRAAWQKIHKAAAAGFPSERHRAVMESESHSAGLNRGGTVCTWPRAERYMMESQGRVEKTKDDTSEQAAGQRHKACVSGVQLPQNNKAREKDSKEGHTHRQNKHNSAF